MSHRSDQPAHLSLKPWILVALAGYVVLVRLLPYVLEQFGVDVDPNGMYPWNFSPVMAICLFGGARFAARKWAFFVPLGAYLLGDLAIWELKGPAFAFYAHQPLVYGAFAVGALLGLSLRRSRSVVGIAGTGLLAESLFFLVTNFGVWLFFHSQPPTFYTLDLSGLVACYVNALPFFGRSLVSTAVYGSLLFGAWAWMQHHDIAPGLAKAASTR